MNPGKNNDIGLRTFSFLRQSEAVSNKISDILYICILVVVCEQDGIFFFLQSFDLRKKIQRWIHCYIQETFLVNLHFCFLDVDNAHSI